MAKRLTAASMTLLLTLTATPRPAHGWGDVGHMMVAHVAYRDLTPPTRARVNALLRLHPKHGEWLGWLPAGTPAAEGDLIVFMIAATWPDQIKRDPAYTSDGSHNGNRPDGSPDPRANRGYADTLMHKYWHFVDVPFSTDGTRLPPVPVPNAEDRIELFRVVLGSPAADALKSYDLAWLLHLVGDVHQPLHSATRVSAAEPDGDDGGNTVRLACPGCPGVLHAFWDQLPGAAPSVPEAIGPAMAAARTLPKASPAAAAKLDARTWIAESLELARQVAYQPPVGHGSGPFALTAEYRARAQSVARDRVALAGARLARLLNEALR